MFPPVWLKPLWWETCLCQTIKWRQNGTHCVYHTWLVPLSSAVIEHIRKPTSFCHVWELWWHEWGMDMGSNLSSTVWEPAHHRHTVEKAARFVGFTKAIHVWVVLWIEMVCSVKVDIGHTYWANTQKPKGMVCVTELLHLFHFGTVLLQ